MLQQHVFQHLLRKTTNLARVWEAWMLTPNDPFCVRRGLPVLRLYIHLPLFSVTGFAIKATLGCCRCLVSVFSAFATLPLSFFWRKHCKSVKRRFIEKTYVVCTCPLSVCCSSRTPRESASCASSDNKLPAGRPGRSGSEAGRVRGHRLRRWTTLTIVRRRKTRSMTARKRKTVTSDTDSERVGVLSA